MFTVVSGFRASAHVRLRGLALGGLLTLSGLPGFATAVSAAGAAAAIAPTAATATPASASAQDAPPKFKVVAFYTAKNDAAHISFVQEANAWFPKAAKEHGFTYESTDNWNNMTAEYLSKFQVVLFLDTRPDGASQRAAFQKYMEDGGAWMGFHFSGFALTPSTYPQNWNWYHETFLGAGQYKGNTWRPTSAVLKVEDTTHAATARLPRTFKSAPNEWYSWQNDLRNKPDIKILLSIDPSSFPLGTGPKPHEIWHSGYYPVVWTHTKYRMLYVNMGHNDMDYGGTNQALSFTFANETQNKLILDALQWLGGQSPVGVDAPAPAKAAPSAGIEFRREGASLIVARKDGKPCRIAILDLQGRKVLQGRANDGRFAFDRSRLGSGRYQVQVETAEGAITEVLDASNF